MTSPIVAAAEALATAPAGPPPAEVLPTREAVARGRFASWVAAAALGAFMVIFAAVRARRSDAFDLALLLKVQRRRSPLVAALMTAGSWPGFPPQSRLIPPLAVGGLWLARLRLEAAYLAGDCDQVRADVSQQPTFDEAFRLQAEQWVKRCEFEDAAWGGPLKPNAPLVNQAEAR